MTLRLLVAALLLANIASAIAVVYARHQHRQFYSALTRLEHERDELNIEFGRLQLEQATLAESQRISRIARERLGMRIPDVADIVVVRP